MQQYWTSEVPVRQYWASEKSAIIESLNGSDTQEIRLMAPNFTVNNRQTPPVPVGDAETMGNKNLFYVQKIPKIAITYSVMENSAIIVHHSSNFKDITTNPVCVYTASPQLPNNASIEPVATTEPAQYPKKNEIRHSQYVRTVQLNHQFQQRENHSAIKIVVFDTGVRNKSELSLLYLMQ